MKTRIRRFWISVSLAAGALAFPLSHASRGHDLPTRWTSGANSTPSWNYLLDDCLDSPILPGSQSLMDVEPAARRGTEDWASSCPAEWAAGSALAVKAAAWDYDRFLRNPISRFSKEMTCWVNEWQMIQHVANRAEQSKQLWAQLPEPGNPPAPDYSVPQLARMESVPLADTCAFDAEYQARQIAGELLAKEVARANEISRYEARISQAMVNAERVQAVIDMDAIAAASVASESSLSANAQGSAALCGGETQEIMTAQCFPNRFAPGIIDEYIAYDLDSRDQHWLGGLGKSWKLRSALGGATAGDAFAANSADGESIAESDVWAVPVENAPEAFIAPDRIPSEDMAANATTDLAAESAANDAQLAAYLDGIVRQAQQSALNLIQSSLEAPEQIVEEADVMPELLPDLSRSLAVASDWMETQQCQLAGELCGWDSAYQAGNWLGEQTLAATNFAMQQTIDFAHMLDLPATSQLGREVFVIYVDSDGNSLAVPSSIARAWNRPEAESDVEQEDASNVMLAEKEAEAGSAADWGLIDQVGAQLVSMLANQLDALGMSMMQAADMLSGWADTQIASRDDSSVR